MMKSPIRVMRVCAAVVVACAFCRPIHASDYFPLQVGNWWHYECSRVYVPDDGIHGRSVPVCYTGGPREFYPRRNLAVSDTIRLDLSSLDVPTWFDEGELRESCAGKLYYVLTGSLVTQLLDDGTAPQVLNGRDAMLVHVGGYSEANLDPGERSPRRFFEKDTENNVADMIGLGGVREHGRWLVFGVDRAFLDPEPPADLFDWQWRLDVTDRKLEEGDQARRWNIEIEYMDFYGAFPPHYTTRLGTFSTPPPHYVRRGSRTFAIYFADGIGILAVSHYPARGGLDLVAANVNGVAYASPTSIRRRSWCDVKKEGFRCGK